MAQHFRKYLVRRAWRQQCWKRKIISTWNSYSDCGVIFSFVNYTQFHIFCVVVRRHKVHTNYTRANDEIHCPKNCRNQIHLQDQSVTRVTRGCDSPGHKSLWERQTCFLARAPSNLAVRLCVGSLKCLKTSAELLQVPCSNRKCKSAKYAMSTFVNLLLSKQHLSRNRLSFILTTELRIHWILLTMKLVISNTFNVD